MTEVGDYYNHYGLYISNDYILQSSTYPAIVSDYLDGVEGTMISDDFGEIYIVWYLEGVPEEYQTKYGDKIEYLIYRNLDCSKSTEGFEVGSMFTCEPYMMSFFQ